MNRVIKRMFTQTVLNILVLGCISTTAVGNVYGNQDKTSEVNVVEEVMEGVYAAPEPKELKLMRLVRADHYDFTDEVQKLEFDETTIRLNTEILEEVEYIMYDGHFDECFPNVETELWESYKSELTPYIFMALANCETGLWQDTRYTWTPAVYSRALSDAGVDMSLLKIHLADSETYIANGLASYLGCGKNCTAPKNSHYHFTGRNDNDSLGPHQILRHYVEGNGGVIEYDCGDSTQDLMNWQDSVIYTYHSLGKYFSLNSTWNKDYQIKTCYELAALVGVAHNTGIAYLVAEDGTGYAGSYWNNAEAVFKFCSDISNGTATEVWEEMIVDWYENEVIPKLEKGQSFAMPSQYYSDKDLETALKSMGLNLNDYAKSFKHKQYYPVKVLLNCVGLELLYKSI